MPVHKVGEDSYQWGRHGKVYSGPDARAKAEAQGRAAFANGYRENGPKLARKLKGARHA